MLTDWIHWLSSHHPDELFTFLWALILLDSPRYALARVVMCWLDWLRDMWSWLRRKPEEEPYTYCPTVTVIIPAFNEVETIEGTLESIWGTYPRLDIIVVDDGSEDETGEVARRYARSHPGITVLSRTARAGKDAALNLALHYAQGEVVVAIDSDTHLAPSALWRIVQPLKNPRVGAVSATLFPSNAFTNLLTWLQAYEYLNAIFLGRMLSYRLGILGIVSGAFGAFRRSVLLKGKGWDVGPPEDLDITLFIRKCGYEIAFVPYAECFSKVPETLPQLFRQRRMWEQGGVIRNHCRKHLDLANPFRPKAMLSNLWVMVDIFIFNLVCPYMILAWMIWFCWKVPPDAGMILFTLYMCYVCFDLVQILTLLYYSVHFWRDLAVCMVFPLAPFYQLFLWVVRIIGLTEELLLHKSFYDDYVPARVRDATWHW